MNIINNERYNQAIDEAYESWRLTHNIITWEVFRVEDVVDMILINRNESNHNLSL